MQPQWIEAFLGGALIGVAVSLMLLWNGRVTGISGIINGALSPVKGDTLWRVFFIGGLLLGGLTLRIFKPSVFENNLGTSASMIAIAGLMVGFGTIMGSGCTSGHGVCGLSRLSIRSMVATGTFIAAGIFAVALVRQMEIWL